MENAPTNPSPSVEIPPDAGKKSSLAQVAAFLVKVGQGNIFTKLQLFEAVPLVAQADRRMRDLRRGEWVILNYKTDPNLTPEQYLLKQIGVRVDLGETVKNARKTISGPKRRRIMERDGHCCQVCGIAAGMAYPHDPNRRAVLTIGHIKADIREGGDEDYNLRAECQACNEESRDITTAPSDAGEVLARITNLGSREIKRKLYRFMEAGRREPEDIDLVFHDWARLPHQQRLEVQTALASQVIKR